MTVTEIILLLLKITGAVVVFIYGMKMMGEGQHQGQYVLWDFHR